MIDGLAAVSPPGGGGISLWVPVIVAMIVGPLAGAFTWLLTRDQTEAEQQRTIAETAVAAANTAVAATDTMKKVMDQALLGHQMELAVARVEISSAKEVVAAQDIRIATLETENKQCKHDLEGIKRVLARAGLGP